MFRLVQDSYVYPKIVGHGVDMHPLAVILAIVCGASLGGIVGVFLADSRSSWRASFIATSGSTVRLLPVGIRNPPKPSLIGPVEPPLAREAA